MYILETETNFPKESIVQDGMLNFDYLGGFKIFDSMGSGQSINLQVASTGLYLTYPNTQGVFNKIRGTRVFIPTEAIEYLNIEQNSQVQTQKQQKSMVKRAAIGSVVGGRRGARIGALTALGGTTTQQEIITYQYTLKFSGKDEGVSCAFKYKVSDGNQSNMIEKFNTIILRNLLNEKLVFNGDFSHLNSKPTGNNRENNSNDSYDALVKLKSLYDQGILTEEEFKAKKAKLLDL